MHLKQFEEAAHDAFRRIPEEYKAGVDGLTVSAEALPHPTHPQIYTLGMCLTEAYPSDWVGPETLRSIVVLYHGSFRRLAEMDPAFDWREELWETLTHELRHHLESLAAEDTLEGVDYAMDEEFARWEGYEFDPWYFQSGEPVGDGVYQVESHFYLEQLWTPEAFRKAERIRFRWRGEEWWIPRPRALGDVHFVWLHELDTGAGTAELVLVRKRSWWESLKAAFRQRAAEILESEAVARRETP